MKEHEVEQTGAAVAVAVAVAGVGQLFVGVSITCVVDEGLQAMRQRKS